MKDPAANPDILVDSRSEGPSQADMSWSQASNKPHHMNDFFSGDQRYLTLDSQKPP